MTAMQEVSVVGFRKVVCPERDSNHNLLVSLDVLLTELPVQL